MTDDLLSALYQQTHQTDRASIQILKQAAPYRLDDDATALMVEYILGQRDDPRAMGRTRVLARLPQDVVWVEFDNRVFTRTQERIAGRLSEEPEEIPHRRGFLFRAIPNSECSLWRAMPVVELRQTGKPLAIPFQIVVSTDGTAKAGWGARRGLEKKFAWIEEIEETWNEEMAGDVMWSYTGTPRSLRESAALRISGQLVAAIMREQDQAGVKAAMDMLTSILEGVMNTVHGLARTTTSILCLLNEVPLRRFVYQPQGHFRANGSLRPFLKNQIITLDLTKGRLAPIKIVQGIIKEAAWRCRAHMVKGFWKADTLRAFDNPPGGRWVWQFSRRHRKECWQIWINPHQRGDASLGWVNQQYEVTA